MSLRVANNEYTRQILNAIASGRPVTQRSLASEMGVALGLTNLLIRRLVAKGYVKTSGIGTRQVRYLMTAAGRAALGRATRVSLESTVRLYTQTREQIRTSLTAISGRCPCDGEGRKTIVFYGAGDVAEIAYVSLQGTDLTLVGIVDDRRNGRFFHLPIRHPDQLDAESLEGVPYAHIVVTTLRHAAAITARLDARAIPRGRVSCL